MVILFTKWRKGYVLNEQYWGFWRNWFSENYPTTNEEASKKSSPTQVKLNAVYRFLNVQSKEYTHSHKRGVFVSARYSNYREFLNDKITEQELIEVVDDWEEWWTKKSNNRLSKLETEGRVSNEQLFHETIDLDELEMWSSVRGLG